MKVFLSWSGKRSQAVAETLGPWMKAVVQSVEPWVSSDMDRGVKWIDAINKSLDDHSFGILCVTPGNVSAPWLNYEAGALAKHLGDGGRVIPYLLDFRSESDLKQPLAQFNACVANKIGTWSLVKTLNNHAEFPQKDAALQESFEMWWPKLEASLIAIKSSTIQPAAERKQEDKIDELLTITRDLHRSFSSADISATVHLGRSDNNSRFELRGVRENFQAQVRALITSLFGNELSSQSVVVWDGTKPSVALAGLLSVEQVDELSRAILHNTGVEITYV